MFCIVIELCYPDHRTRIGSYDSMVRCRRLSKQCSDERQFGVSRFCIIDVGIIQFDICRRLFQDRLSVCKTFCRFYYRCFFRCRDRRNTVSHSGTFGIERLWLYPHRSASRCMYHGRRCIHMVDCGFYVSGNQTL